MPDPIEAMEWHRRLVPRPRCANPPSASTRSRCHWPAWPNGHEVEIAFPACRLGREPLDSGWSGAPRCRLRQRRMCASRSRGWRRRRPTTGRQSNGPNSCVRWDGVDAGGRMPCLGPAHIIEPERLPSVQTRPRGSAWANPDTAHSRPSA